MDSISCIYILYWDINYPYIGQTVNFHTRYNKHINEIKQKIHCNYKILQEYEKYNALPNIEILFRIKNSKDDLNYFEELFIKEFDSIDNGLNIISGGYSVGIGTNNSASKYSKDQLKLAFELLADVNNSYKQISTITKINLDTIKKIGQGAQHLWLHEEYPKISAKVLSISSKERYKNSASAISQGKQYRKIMSPNGIIYTVTNTLEFSKQHNLPNGNLCSVLLGKRKTVNGWKGID